MWFLKATPEKAQTGKRLIHQGGLEQQQYIDYAMEISNDPNFAMLLKAECGSLTVDCRSISVGSNGYYDYGLCQVNKGWHPETVNDPRFFTDYKWQLRECYRLYKGGTRFYGVKRIPLVKKFFHFEES